MTSCAPFGLHAGDNESQHSSASIVAYLHVVDAVLYSKVEIVMVAAVKMELEQV